jgi:hypothetical protein
MFNVLSALAGGGQVKPATSNKGFLYFATATCGIAAAFLWSAEGVMIMSFFTLRKR